MRKILVAAAIAAFVGIPAAAQADRVPAPAPGTNGDYCTNLDGTQVWADNGKTWKFITSTPYFWDCKAL